LSKTSRLNLAGAKAIEASDKEREQKCLMKIQGSCVFFDCDVVPFVMISGMGVEQAGFKVVARPRNRNIN